MKFLNFEVLRIVQVSVNRGRFHQHVNEQYFTCADPKRAKRQSKSSHKCLFVLLGSACKMLVKWTLGVNFTNVFCARFSYERLFLVKFKLEKGVRTKNAREKC